MFRHLVLALALASSLSCSLPAAARDIVEIDVIDGNGFIFAKAKDLGQPFCAQADGPISVH